MTRIFRAIADWLGGYERITCPSCNLHIRFRGVTDIEANHLRAHMADHAKTHTT